MSSIVKLKCLKKIDTFLQKQFKSTGHSPNKGLVQPMEKFSYDENSTVRFNTIKRFETKLKWIKLLQSAYVFSLLEFRKLKFRSHGKRQKGNDNCKRCAAQKYNTSLNDLSTKLREHGRHAMLLFLSSLLIPGLRILDIEANRFYDRNHQMYEAALLTKCYTQHALRPLIVSEIDHKRHFIKTPFINKGIDLKICLVYFRKNMLHHLYLIICYKYNKPIRNMIFNFNTLVSDLDIDALIHESVKIPKFIYQSAGHVVTGYLEIIPDSRIRNIVSKGPKYRFPSLIDFNRCREEIASALNDFGNRWCKR